MSQGIPRASSERLHQAIARQLGTAILRGEIAPGTALEGEIEQSGALGVSRTAYREALKILAAKGLIESRPKAGTQVLPRARWNMLDTEILAWMFRDEPDAKFVTDLFELRRIVEPAAAALAAQRRSPEQVETMRAALAEMTRHGVATAQGRDADQRFHDELIHASGNEVLASLSSSIGAAVQLTTAFKARASRLPRDGTADHLAVLAAIDEADPAKARRTMEELVVNALDDMGMKPES